jgi:hypothetical protein
MRVALPCEVVASLAKVRATTDLTLRSATTAGTINNAVVSTKGSSIDFIQFVE